ncbi:MAG: PAS domain S-box protein, partial [Verrucomicrobiota bacterium]
MVTLLVVGAAGLLYQPHQQQLSRGIATQTAAVSAVLLAVLLGLVYVLLRRTDARLHAQQAALRESEARLGQLAAQSGIIAWEVDARGRYTYMSPVVQSVLGYHPDELAGRRHFYELHPAAGREEFKAAAFEAFERKVPFQNFVNAVQAKDGHLVWVATNGIPLLNADGSLRGYRGSDTDITVRKQAEEDIKRQAALIRALLDSIPDIIFFKDLAGVYMGCNPPFARFVGKSREEILGKTDYDLFDPALAESFRTHDQCMLRSRELRHNEEWITYPDGRTILLDTLKTPYYGPDGKLIGSLGISRDITARKQAEEGLREQRDLLASIIEGTNVGTWRWNIQTGVTEFNERWAEIVGSTLAELAPISIQTWLGLVHPEDLKESDAMLRKHFAGTLGYYDCECRMRHKNGSWVWVHDRGKVVEWTSAGKPLIMTGTHADVTARKQGEEALRERTEALARSEANTQLLLNSVVEGIYGIDLNGNCTFCNQAGLRLLGYQHPDELLGKDMHCQIHTRHSDGTPFPAEECRVYQAVLIGEGTHVDDEVLWRSDGTPFRAEYWSYPQRRDGVVVGAVVTFVDITERTRAEMEVRTLSQAIEQTPA